MTPNIINLSGWLPAIIFPVATLIQLISILRRRSSQGVSWIAWTLFGVANISVYVYTEKYLAPQTIIGFLGSALLDFVIAAMAIKARVHQKV
jgi:uncharacterized protein with PQ loop repeat